jgi:hypothetical protein
VSQKVGSSTSKLKGITDIKKFVDHKSSCMSDKKEKIKQPENTHIGVNDLKDVENIHRQFPYMSHEQILDAIQKAGPDRENILRYLKGAEIHG